MKKQLMSGIAFTLGILVLSNFMTITTAASQDDGAVYQVFGLSSGELVELEIPTEIQANTKVAIELNGQPLKLLLSPSSYRASNFSVSVYGKGGIEGFQPSVSKVVKGKVSGLPDSRVVGSVLESGLFAKIVLPTGDVYFVEPVSSKIDEAIYESMHVVYTSANVIPGEGTCVLLDAEKGRRVFERKSYGSAEPSRVNSNVNARGGGVNQICELAVDTDVEYFEDYGSEQATIDRIELIIAIVNDQYDAQVDIIHQITSINVRTSEPDPYSATDYLGIIGDIQNEWINNQQNVPRDIAHLFTGKEVDGSIIGAAFIGAICDFDIGYGFSQSDFNGQLACATDLTAHEFGHNWDSNHCDCDQNTMNPFITCANDFTNGTINTIVSFRDSLDCLEDEPSILLGDVNLDGSVDLLDVGPFIDLLNSGGFQAEADINQDGVVNLLDVSPFVDILSGN